MKSVCDAFDPNFSLERLCRSDTARRLGIDNRPSAEVLQSLYRLSHFLAQVQALLGHPLQITSGFRSAALNEAVGGVADSQHTAGQAVDFRCPAYGTPADIAYRIGASELAFDQLILEYGRWLHVSIAPPDRIPRRELLSIWSSEQGYVSGIVVPPLSVA
jgi:zinc D-Ala-D-Ala carboxypeptidase